jgi:hypothetical protein
MSNFFGIPGPDQREYIVTLHFMKDSDSFYEDMETPGGNLYIPDRVVECTNRRTISRNTHYMLTYDEAKTISHDLRVLAVAIGKEGLKELGVKTITNGYSQQSEYFSKENINDANNINWGFIRSSSKTPIQNWGSEGIPVLSSEFKVDSSGKNVDVFIADDGMPFPHTKEYMQNADGSGFTRMVQRNWATHQHESNPTYNGSYFDTIISEDINNVTQFPSFQDHAAHVMGTAAGNTQGWAKDANIYNLFVLELNEYVDLVRLFHRDKPINPKTGFKNPTIMNNSWSDVLYANSKQISKVHFRGTDYFPSGGSGPYNWIWDDAVLASFLINPYFVNGNPEKYFDVPWVEGKEWLAADFIDMMNEGVVVCASAGNTSWYIDKIGGPDYDNYFTTPQSVSNVYYNRGAVPHGVDGGSEDNRVICVGSLGNHAGASDYYNHGSLGATAISEIDYKAEYTNFGPRIDVYAPGSSIMSIHKVYPDQTWGYGLVGVYDNRSPFNDHINGVCIARGTSMATPQVTGMLACLAEKYPRMNQRIAREWIKNISLPTLASTSGGAGTDPTDAGFGVSAESANNIMFNKSERNTSYDEGSQFLSVTYPKTSKWIRPSSGVAYPRVQRLHNRNHTTEISLSCSHTVVSRGETFYVTLSSNTNLSELKVPYIITAIPVEVEGNLYNFNFDMQSDFFTPDDYAFYSASVVPTLKNNQADISIDPTGVITLENGEYVLPITVTNNSISAASNKHLNFRLDYFGTPSITVLLKYDDSIFT